MSNRTGLRASQHASLSKHKAKACAATLIQALKFQQTGRVAEAQALCHEILSKFPRHLESLHLLGVTHYQQGHYEEAERLLRRAVAADPRSAEAHCNLAAVLLALRRFGEALAMCDRALSIRPSYAEALSNRGGVLMELGKFEEAAASYEKSLAIKPGCAVTLSNRGGALLELRRFDEAAASCAKATALDPRHAAAFSNLGNALLALHRSDEALASFDKAVAIDPGLSAAWLGRGNACFDLKRFDDARAAFHQAIATKPDYVKALGQLAYFDQMEGDIDGALAGYDRALAIQPDNAEIICRKIFALDFAPNANFVDQQEARRHWWRHLGAKIAAASQFRHANPLDPDRPLVLGYVSSDFRRHSAATCFKPVLRNHDKSRFRIVCYSNSIEQDSATEEFSKIADVWRDTSQCSDEGLARQVHADKIDILIDLSGHTGGNRLGVFARKPAPLQVTAWGHATGTGLEAIDYLFSDPVSTPASVRHLFAEKISDLPCCITVDAAPGEPRPADSPIVSKGHATFGVFNRTSKISDASIAVWAEILRAEPRSRLLIKQVDDESGRARLRDKFGQHGISADRLDFLGSTTREEHLAAFRHVDICLDPFPHNGGISTWESLQMGVPVVAKLGDTTSSRVAGAILTAVGLNEWVASSDQEYVAIALKQAATPDRLNELRHALPARVATSSAGNPEKYTRAVEEAYRAMWADYCRRNS